MKRLLSMLLAIAMVLSMIPTAFAEATEEPQVEVTAPVEETVAAADETTTPEQPADPVVPAEYAATSGNYTYTVSGGKATITDCKTSISGKITIPSTLGGYPVTAIGYQAFYSCDSLTSVTIPDSVTSIGSYAFYSCTSLTSVTIPDSVTSIGDRAFYSCDSLTSIDIPDSVTTIGNWAFSYCDSLTNVYYGGTKAQWNAITIGSYNTSLTNATIHFVENPEADYEYTIENGEATITGYTGAGGDVTIPSTLGGYPVTTIGKSAFEGNEFITSVVIPDSVVTIGDEAFSWCFGVSSVTLGNNVAVIGNRAFEETTVGDIVFPDSLTTIGERAFYWACAGTVHIPAGVTSIGAGAFNAKISVDENNAAYCNDAYGVLYNKDKTKLFRGYNLPKEYIIPDTVTEVGEGAFEMCHSLESIVIPQSVKTIGDGAFYDCFYLKTVIIHDGMTLGEEAFAGCGNLTDVLFKGDATVGKDAFAHCYSLTDIFYYSGANISRDQCGDSADWHWIRSTTTVEPTCTQDGYIDYISGRLEPTYRQTLKARGHVEEILPAVAPTEETTGLTQGKKCAACGVVLVAQEIVPVLRSYTYTAEDGKATITGYTGNGGDAIVPATIDDYLVVAIGPGVFSSCESLTSITIPDSVIAIGENAFYNCSNLTEVYYGDEEQRWNKITIQSGNDALTNAAIYFSEHTHRMSEAVTAPTCTEGGYTTYTCFGCDYSYTADFVGALGHNYAETYFAPANGKPGYTRYTCSRCGDTYTVTDGMNITKHPEDQNGKIGETVTFKVEAIGAVSYQWQRIKVGATAWTNISGATGASYAVKVSSSNVIPYRCVLKDAKGNELITAAATIILPVPLMKITNTAGNQHVIKNSSISFTVELDNTDGITYQWQRCKSGNNWTNVSYAGNQTKTVTFSAASWAQYPFRCEITDANGTKIYTDTYTYTLVQPPIAPNITANPKDDYVLAGGTATFCVEAVGSGLTYQWWRSKNGGETWGEYTGTGSTTSSISLKVYANQEYLYMCEVKDGYGNTMKSKVVQPHLIKSVKITAQPTLTVDNGAATITFTATGDVKTYQWQRLKSNGWADAVGASYVGYDTNTLTTTVKATWRCRIVDKAGNITYTNQVVFAG